MQSVKWNTMMPHFVQHFQSMPGRSDRNVCSWLSLISYGFDSRGDAQILYPMLWFWCPRQDGEIQLGLNPCQMPWLHNSLKDGAEGVMLLLITPFGHLQSNWESWASGLYMQHAQWKRLTLGGRNILNAEEWHKANKQTGSSFNEPMGVFFLDW